MNRSACARCRPPPGYLSCRLRLTLPPLEATEAAAGRLPGGNEGGESSFQVRVSTS